MTFEELDERFPNGFDDAEITRLSIDYQNRVVKFEVNLRGNSPDSPDAQEYRRAVLTAYDFYYFAVEPPDSDHISLTHSKITVDGLPEDSDTFPLFAELKPNLPSGAFYCRFFVHDWNSFIHIAAKDARLSWIQDEARTEFVSSDS